MLDRLEGEGEGEGDQDTRDVVAAELVRALETTEELSRETRRREKKNKGKSIKKKLPRKPKSQDNDDEFDFGFVGSLLDALDLEQESDQEEFGDSGKRKEEEVRSSKDADSKTASLEREPKESEPEESCEESVAAVQVKVCVPDYTVQPQRLYFKAQETYDEKYCYTKYVFCTYLFYM